MDYRLLKDLPDCKAGAILKPLIGGDYKMMVEEKSVGFYFKQTVENSPEWFEPIAEAMSDETSEPKKDALNIFEEALREYLKSAGFKFYVTRINIIVRDNAIFSISINAK